MRAHPHFLCSDTLTAGTKLVLCDSLGGAANPDVRIRKDARARGIPFMSFAACFSKYFVWTG
jgi:hypothetical protein